MNKVIIKIQYGITISSNDIKKPSREITAMCINTAKIITNAWNNAQAAININITSENDSIFSNNHVFEIALRGSTIGFVLMLVKTAQKTQHTMIANLFGMGWELKEINLEKTSLMEVFMIHCLVSITLIALFSPIAWAFGKRLGEKELVAWTKKQGGKESK